MNTINKFTLSSRIKNDSVLIKDLELCQLRLIKDGDLDWFLLIPKRANIYEIYELDQSDQLILLKEINLVSKRLVDIKSPDKLNIGAIGNMVPQLHVHIIARYKVDRAWPSPIWGTSSIEEFDESNVSFWKSKI